MQAGLGINNDIVLDSLAYDEYFKNRSGLWYDNLSKFYRIADSPWDLQ